MGSSSARWLLLGWIACLAPSVAQADASPERPYVITEEREACSDYQPLRKPHFGDLHVHTAFSQDASTQGTRSQPSDAYRFARGEPLGIQPYDEEGVALRSLRLERPLDFAAVTDHAEQLGEVAVCETPGLPGHDSLVCKMFRGWPRLAFFVMNMRSTYFEDPSRFGFCGPGGVHCLQAALTPWAEIQEAAEGFYDRSSACEFTSFVGYEWTGATGARNLHRNVIFRNANVPTLPISYYEAPSAGELHQSLRQECSDAGTGCDVLAIPHNSNLSGGRMFSVRHPDGTPLRRDAVEAQRAIEPLVEVMQHKGDSECLAGIGSEDELCAFEKLPYGTFQGKYVPWLAEAPHPNSFVREALKRGLLEGAGSGINPFQYGIIASTDTHLGAAGYVSETRHAGHGGAGKLSPDALPVGLVDDLEMNPGGLAVVWAEENSRDSLFAAMQRRETYGTSGPRMIVRFFGGWQLPMDLCGREDFAAMGYARGVPMGAELPARKGIEAPRFALQVQADPGTATNPGHRLQQLQIVKGWVADGATHERVYSVAGDPQAGSDVSAEACTPSLNGRDALCTVWEDPDFDAQQPAFYYLRALETPSCRWSTLACNESGVRCAGDQVIPEGFEACCDAGHRRLIQERAWSSPIWYQP